jgi:hypothetical protein
MGFENLKEGRRVSKLVFMDEDVFDKFVHYISYTFNTKAT